MDLFDQGLVFELKGLNTEAFGCYAKLLEQDPTHQLGKEAFARLSGKYMTFDGTNQAMLDRFKMLKNEEQLLEFEQWLLQTNK